MPKQISALQLHNLWNVMTRNIPAAAVTDWTDHFRRMSMGTTSLDKNRMFLVPDEAPKMRVLNETADIVRSWGDDYRKSLPGDISQKMNRQKLVINSFYNSIHEGMWEGAKALAEDYEGALPGLKKIYETECKAKEIESGFIKLLIGGYEEGIAYQCVAFIKGFVQLLEADISTSGYGSGYYAAGSIASKSKGVFREKGYTKGMSIPAGTVLSNLAPAGKYGHVFAVLKDIGDYVIAVEQAGELAEGDAPYDPAAGIGPKAQGYKWHSNSSLYWYNANERYRSYYNTEEKKHMLTMMPGITLIPKSYLEDGRKISMAVPDEASSQAVAKTVRKLGLDSLNDPKKVEKFNETWWKSLGGR